jgi:hypothetical protein
MMISLSDTLRLLLDGIGRSEEYEYYLRRFLSSEGKFSAVLCPTLRIIEEAPEALIFQLHVLSQLGLNIAILLSGPSSHIAEKKLWEAGLKENYRDSILRYPDSTLEYSVFDAASKYSSRIHLIRLRGSIRTDDNSEITVFNLNKPPQLPVHFLDRAILHISEEIITGCRTPLHLSITSPANLLREMFTVKGAGTIVRKGSRILRMENESLKELNKENTVQLLEKSFRKSISNASFLDEITLAYIEDQYRGAALLIERPEGLYLSKFSVDTIARGEGIAQEIWDQMINTERNELKRPIFWRSRNTNSLNHWYSKQSDGRQDYGQWTVFWIGLPVNLIPDVIHYCADKKEDFV